MTYLGPTAQIGGARPAGKVAERSGRCAGDGGVWRSRILASSATGVLFPGAGFSLAGARLRFRASARRATATRRGVFDGARAGVGKSLAILSQVTNLRHD